MSNAYVRSKDAVQAVVTHDLSESQSGITRARVFGRDVTNRLPSHTTRSPSPTPRVPVKTSETCVETPLHAPKRRRREMSSTTSPCSISSRAATETGAGVASCYDCTRPQPTKPAHTAQPYLCKPANFAARDSMSDSNCDDDDDHGTIDDWQEASPIAELSCYCRRGADDCALVRDVSCSALDIVAMTMQQLYEALSQ